MRISTQQIYDTGLRNMQDVTQQQQKTQSQLSSGKRLTQPSDDPVAAARVLQLNQTLSLSGQYQNNITLATNNLNLEDSTLSSVSSTLTKIRGLALQANDGSLNASDRQAIATQVTQLLTQLTGLANTKDSSGQYLFSGNKGDTIPFAKDASGNYQYQGDEGQRSVAIDDGVQLPVNDNGKSVFVDIPSAQKTFYTQASPNNTAKPPAAISSGMVIDQSTFDNFYPSNMSVTFSTGGSGQLQYSIQDRATGRQLVAPTDYSSGAPIQAEGIQFNITGKPQPGDTFFVQSSGKQSVMGSVEKLVYGLQHYNNTDVGNKAFNNLIQDTLANLDNAQASVSKAQTDVGARQNTVSTTNDLHTQSDSQTQAVLSKLQDLDYAAAASQLSMQNMVLQAAQLSFSQVSKLSLFNNL
ncbi:flagellar hook-associated protein FlgL [Mangrovitalea sediminis]|uniref:flagellar hook-associated protein FlgL n=1 Tax=Mangrovitalea sediminis TaxID=1982043 RepID=UPI000BE5837E|nr:flagellar hook-associated protein FlgL [Mangrovitalea sediminis]